MGQPIEDARRQNVSIATNQAIAKMMAQVERQGISGREKDNIRFALRHGLTHARRHMESVFAALEIYAVDNEDLFILNAVFANLLDEYFCKLTRAWRYTRENGPRKH